MTREPDPLYLKTGERICMAYFMLRAWWKKDEMPEMCRFNGDVCETVHKLA